MEVRDALFFKFIFAHCIPAEIKGHKILRADVTELYIFSVEKYKGWNKCCFPCSQENIYLTHFPGYMCIAHTPKKGAFPRISFRSVILL